MIGSITKLVKERHFGFVESEGGSVFFHGNELQPGVNFNTLQEGDSLEFEVTETPKGKSAVNVRKLISRG